MKKSHFVCCSAKNLLVYRTHTENQHKSNWIPKTFGQGNFLSRTPGKFLNVEINTYLVYRGPPIGGYGSRIPRINWDISRIPRIFLALSRIPQHSHSLLFLHCIFLRLFVFSQIYGRLLFTYVTHLFEPHWLITDLRTHTYKTSILLGSAITVKPLNSGQLWFLEKVSAIEKFPL